MSLVVAVGVCPYVVVSFQTVVIVYAFEVAVVDGGKRYGEAVLAIAKVDLFRRLHALADRLSFVGDDDVVVHFQVFKHQPWRACGYYLHWVEDRQSMRATEDERAVGHTAGGSVVELEASDAVCLVIDGDAVVAWIHLVESVHGAHPDVASLILLNTRHVSA